MQFHQFLFWFVILFFICSTSSVSSCFLVCTPSLPCYSTTYSNWFSGSHQNKKDAIYMINIYSSSWWLASPHSHRSMHASYKVDHVIVVITHNFRNDKWLFYSLTFGVRLQILTFDTLLRNKNNYRVTSWLKHFWLIDFIYYYLSLIYKFKFINLFN